MAGIPQSFNAGFARGLAGALGNARQDELLRKRDRENSQNRLFDVFTQTALERAEDPDTAISWLQQAFPDRFKGKEGQANLQILQRALPQAAAAALGGGAGAQGGGYTDPRAMQPQERAAQALGVPQAPVGTPAPGGAPPVGAIGSAGSQVQPSQAPSTDIYGTPPVGAVGSPQVTTPQAQTPPDHPLSLSGMAMRASATQMRVRESVIARLAQAGMPLDEQETQYYLTNGQLARPYSGSAGLPRSVPGELPDGTPAYAIFDPIERTYRDQDGAILHGFQPRTSVGSRTLGGDRESVALELYNKQASRLTGEQMARVNTVVRERAVENAKNRGLATGEAANVTKMNAPLTVDDAAQVQAPIGTAMRDLTGQTPMTPKQQETRQSLTTLTTKIPQLTALINLVIPDYGEGIVNRARAVGEIKYKSAAGDPALTQLRAMAKSMAGEVSRVIQGQTGVLSDQDTQRANAILTDTDSWFSDTRAQALAKVAVMQEMIDKINRAIPNPQATGQTAGQPRVAKPISEAKPSVSNAAPAAQKVNGAWVIP